MKQILSCLLLLVPVTVFAIDVTEPFDDPAMEQRYRELVHELRCLVCQNQTVADSNAPLAVDLREQVRAQIEAGHSDEEIIEYLTARYGDFVLYRPPMHARTILLWASPVLLLVLAGFVALRVLRGGRARVPVSSDAARRRVRSLLNRGEDT